MAGPWAVQRKECGYTDVTRILAVLSAVRVVLDTSVLVAAMRSRTGASFHLLSMLPSRDFEIVLTVALYMEWQAVLKIGRAHV